MNKGTGNELKITVILSEHTSAYESKDLRTELRLTGNETA